MSDPAPRIVLRPIANPLPLGFLALAAATLLAAGLQLHWLPAGQGGAVALVLLAFVFPAQLIASVLGFLARDAVAGTGMGILAGSWLSVGLVTLGAPPGGTSRALGLFLRVAAAAMLVPAIGAAGGKLVPAAVLATTALRFAVTGGYEWTGDHHHLRRVGAAGRPRARPDLRRRQPGEPDHPGARGAGAAAGPGRPGDAAGRARHPRRRGGSSRQYGRRWWPGCWRSARVGGRPEPPSAGTPGAPAPARLQ